MKTPTLFWGALLAAIGMELEAPAATVYSNYQGISIPTDFTGIYLDIDNGVTSTSSFPGWDINPFFGGVGIGNSAAFQPLRSGASNLDRDLNLAAGTTVVSSSSLSFASGVGGSGNIGHEHMGASADQFQPGTEGFLGFKFTKNGGSGPFYGWMRVTLTNNVAGAVVTDWGYDDAGGSIVVGRVQQGAASGGTQLVTLSPGTGETFSLASALTNTGGNINSVLKTGAGSTTLGTANTFTGSTTVSGGTLGAGVAGALGSTSAVNVNTGGTLLLGGSGDRINNAAALNLAGGKYASAGLSENVGALTLTANSVIDFGAGASVLTFASGNLGAFRLDLWNWSGTPGAGGGADQLRFTSQEGLASQLSQIHFYSDGGTTELSFSASYPNNGFVGSFGDVVPVPEASTVFGSLALLVFAGRREWLGRRRAGVSGSGSV